MGVRESKKMKHKKGMCVYLLDSNRKKIERMVKHREARSLTHAIDKCIENYRMKPDKIRGEG